MKRETAFTLGWKLNPVVRTLCPNTLSALALISPTPYSDTASEQQTWSIILDCLMQGVWTVHNQKHVHLTGWTVQSDTIKVYLVSGKGQRFCSLVTQLITAARSGTNAQHLVWYLWQSKTSTIRSGVINNQLRSLATSKWLQKELLIF